MTEAVWLACDEVRPMLTFLHNERASDRKLRLFGCAACRRIWELMSDPRCREAVEASERFSDGLISKRELDLLSAAAEEAFEDAITEGDGDESNGSFSAHAASYASSPSLDLAVLTQAIAAIVETRVDWGVGTEKEHMVQAARELAAQATLLRDVFGNPFRHLMLDRAWLMPTVMSLASQMYDSRDFGAMPILADALQDAGCTSDDILDHCRGPGPHVRGCWVVDLVLGRE